MLWVLEKGAACTLVFAKGNQGKFPKGGDVSAQIKGQEIVSKRRNWWEEPSETRAKYTQCTKGQSKHSMGSRLHD